MKALHKLQPNPWESNPSLAQLQVRHQPFLPQSDLISVLPPVPPGQQPFPAIITAYCLSAKQLQLGGTSTTSGPYNPQYTVHPGLTFEVDLGSLTSPHLAHAAPRVLTNPKGDATPLSCSLGVGSSCVSESTLQAMADSIRQLIPSCINSPGAAVLQMPMLPASHWAQLAEFSNTYRRFAGPDTLTGLLDEQVRQTPNQPALIYEDQGWNSAAAAAKQCTGVSANNCRTGTQNAGGATMPRLIAG